AIATRQALGRNGGVEDREAAAETQRALRLTRKRPFAPSFAIAIEVVGVPPFGWRQVELAVGVPTVGLEEHLEASGAPQAVRSALAGERRRDELLRAFDAPADPQPCAIGADDPGLDPGYSGRRVSNMGRKLIRLHEDPCVLGARVEQGS